MKQHKYALLDGLRGLAAIFVLMRHTPFCQPSFYRSYLAVDLFFVLSGFVIANAYDAKIRDGVLTFRRFMELRLIRLYPVFLLSVALSAAGLVGQSVSHHAMTPAYVLDLAGTVVAAAFFLPFPLMGNGNLFPMNGPYWSLFFELLVNAAYARLRRWLSSRVLGGVMLFSGAGLLLTVLGNGNLDIGFQWSWQHLAAGLLRSMFGIAAGLLLHRHRDALSRIMPGLSPWLAFPVVGMVLAFPNAGHLDWLIDILCVVAVFPLCVLVGARDAGGPKKLCLILGSASYPVYVLHVPLGNFVLHFWHSVDLYAPYAGIGFILAMIAGSVLLEKYYDIPVREKLLRLGQGASPERRR